MKPRGRVPWFFVFILTAVFTGIVSGVEYSDGSIRLVLHEGTGRFSLYYTSNTPGSAYEPLFMDQDPRTSFLSVLVNNRAYRMGEASVFRTRVGDNSARPSISFESPFLMVTEEFSFIKTLGSGTSNGVRIDIRAVNLGKESVQVGFRFLLDTNLGENGGGPPFVTDQRSLTTETVIEGRNNEQRWISRNNRIGLMGSLSLGNEKKPDLVHFANWKRLNEVSWKLTYVPERNFNYLPYSIGDSAVCYYFDPLPLAGGASRTVSILLSAEDGRGFDPNPPSPGTVFIQPVLPEAPRNPPASPQDETRSRDLAILQDMISRLDAYMSGRLSLSDEELATMELIITGIKARYGLP
ncbi:MAG: hypothetical protein LBQ38_14185 [Spirochaetaceae bacterium]|jgi:hypothetical protein|nr:hypothetical protein [Spirochaetaceae bacterium]